MSQLCALCALCELHLAPHPSTPLPSSEIASPLATPCAYVTHAYVRVHAACVCAYSGHIDDGDKVRDGCGNKRCDAANPLMRNNCRCGFGNCDGHVTPYRPEDLGAMLAAHAEHGVPYGGIGTYTGYNEIVVESASWLASLPRAIEAVFITECADGERNTNYAGTAHSCSSAHAKGRKAHAAFLEAFGLSKTAFPLLRLRPDNFQEPFVTERG